MMYKMLACVLCAVLFSYASISKQNELTKLQLRLPKITKEIESIEKSNQYLRYLIEAFENPLHLMQLAREPEYAHLKTPYLEEVISVPVAIEEK